MNAFSGSNFVGNSLPNYLINSPRVLGQVKCEPADFIVEEEQRTHKTTVRPENDLSEAQLNSFTGDLVSATIVMERLTTYEGCLRLARRLRINPKHITYAGMKDRWAITAQRIVFTRDSGVTLEQVRAISQPKELNGTGFFIKDVARAEKPLRQGHLVANHFRIRVNMPEMTAAQIEAYIAPRIKLLEGRDWLFPNFYNRQRLGRRQNLTKIGYTLMTSGSAAAIELYLTDTSDLENPAATAVRKKLAETYELAKTEAASRGCDLAEVDEYFWAMGGHLDKHTSLNLANEHTLVKRVHALRNFNDAVRDTKEKITGMWVGSYQSYWFNRALERYMRGEMQTKDKRIPLYIKESLTEDWYRRHNMAEAIVENVDPFVRQVFLTPPPRTEYKGHRPGHAYNRRGNRNYREPELPETPGPRRNAFTRCRLFQQRFEDGAWHVQFKLESGVYATTMLQMFVDLNSDDEADELTNC
jgi:tRNA(Glu) U13 pseudouridine synthase TruD